MTKEDREKFELEYGLKGIKEVDGKKYKTSE
jgi:hypothetical protein